MIAVYHNHTISQEPFLVGVENHALELVAYIDTASIRAARQRINRGWGKPNDITKVLNTHPIEGFRAARCGDVYVGHDGIAWMLHGNIFQGLDQDLWQERKPSTITEYLHRKAPFQVTEEMSMGFWEYLVEEEEVAFPDQVSDEMYFLWREINKKQYPILLEY